MKPICVGCQRFYRPKQTGIPFVEQMPDGAVPVALPGKIEARRWSPYKIWLGDLWECPDCKSEVIVGVGRNPLAEHFQDNFAAELEHAGGESVLKINDC